MILILAGSTAITTIERGYKTYCNTVYSNDYKVELIALSDLEAVEGGRPIREDPGESASYSRGETNSYRSSEREILEVISKMP